MNKKDKGNNYTILRISENYGAKYEFLNEFNESFFSDTYYNAFLLTEKLILRNKKYKIEKVNNSEYNNEKREYSIFSEIGEDNQNRIYNIIPFYGPKGTGKTSIMLSFINALSKLNPTEYIEYKQDYENLKRYVKSPLERKDIENIYFTCLDNIDASLLCPEEDIFEVILARMLKTFLQHERYISNYEIWNMENEFGEFGAYRKADIINKFEEIFGSIRNLQSKKKLGQGESAVELLRSLSGSLDLRETFRKFVPLYLKVLDKPNRLERERYLVISIDDIDMNGSNSYNMIEQIHRYLMVPNVIIYLAVSGKELMSVCKRHFSEEKYDNSDRLAIDYLDKVLPISQRVYLPKIGMVSSVVCMYPDGLSIKRTILWKIVRRTRVCFDGCGVKTHFYEPYNIRNLVNLYFLLDNMEKLNDEDESEEENEFIKNPKYVYNLNKNINKLLDDIVYRMAEEKLDKEHMKVFQEIYELEGVRHRNKIIRYILRVKGKENFSKSVNGIRYIHSYKKFGPSYGELLRGIYLLGRAEEAEKPLIHCILALESVLLTRSYIHSQILESETSEEKEKERLKEKTYLMDYLGSSITGSWGNYLIPPIVKEKEIRRCAYIKNIPLGNEIGIPMPNYIYNRIISDSPIHEKRLDECKKWIETSNIVRILELFFMFKIEDKPDNIKLKIGFPYDELFTTNNTEDKAIKKLEEEKFGIYLFGTYSFDVMGFMINSMRYREVLENVHHKILEAISVYTGKNMEDLEEIKDLISSEWISMMQSYEEWENSYGYMAIPAQTLDVTYNLIKRVKRWQNNRGIDGIGTKEILNEICFMYKKIEELLNKQDEFYSEKHEQEKRNRQKEKKCNIKFEKIFNQCPFIYNFLNICEEEGSDFQNMFVKFMNICHQWGETDNKDYDISSTIDE